MLRVELGVEAELSKGSNGVFVVTVGDDVVAKKTLDGFPTTDQIVASVKAALDAKRPG